MTKNNNSDSKISRVDALLNEVDLQDLEFSRKFRELKKLADELEKELELSHEETREAYKSLEKILGE